MAGRTGLRSPGARRIASTIAWLAVVLSLLRGGALRESLPSRASFLRDHASQDLPARRLAGSAGAPDRLYLAFLEDVRRRVPADAGGIAIYVRRPSNWQVTLAEYFLAPIPVLVSPREIPRGWGAAVYGDWREPGWRVLSPLTGGALLERPR